MLAAARRRVDAGQHQRARRGAAGALRQQLRIVALRGRRRAEGAEDRDRPPGPAAGRVDRELRGLPQPLDSGAVLAPRLKTGGPSRRLLRRERVDVEPGEPRVVLVDPGPELGGAQTREGQQQVAEIALRIDGDHRHAVDGRFLDQPEAQAGLAAAGHADADRVRDEIARVVQHRLVEGLAGGDVVAPAEVEEAEFFEGGRAGGRCGAVSRPCRYRKPTERAVADRGLQSTVLDRAVTAASLTTEISP